MAHFRGTVQENRGETSRLGSRNSGLVATCDGWNIGLTAEYSKTTCASCSAKNRRKNGK